MSRQTCIQCEHFYAFNPPSHGECYRYPPTPYKDGTVDAPRIKANRPACGEFESLPNGETAQPATKEHVPSHGLVMKGTTKPPQKQPPGSPSRPQQSVPTPAPTLAQGFKKLTTPTA
jgi:hypothetical protein